MLKHDKWMIELDPLQGTRIARSVVNTTGNTRTRAQALNPKTQPATRVVLRDHGQTHWVSR